MHNNQKFPKALKNIPKSIKNSFSTEILIKNRLFKPFGEELCGKC
jgi:hypothetical protein